MGKAVELRKCIRVGNVRKDIREIAEFYFDLDNKTNFTTYSVLCSPLIAANDCIGVIHCLNKKTDDKLFIEDEEVPLGNDGTFRLQVPFRDGIQNYSIKAIDKDGVDSRNITMKFERVTPVDNTNPNSKAESEWF